jgi:GNAT superfamily N-acetyltransferase
MYFQEPHSPVNTGKIKVVEIITPGLIKKFIRLPYKIYKDNPYWVPPLNIEMKEKLDRGKNPFFKYGDIKLFGAFDEDGIIVGRTAAVINPLHNNIYNDRMGFFGLFECKDEIKIAAALFQKVKSFLKEKGFDSVTGPVNFTTNDESGILVENFHDYPMIMCDYSPPYYDRLIKCCGFEKSIDLYSYEGGVEHLFPGKYKVVNNRADSNPSITFRTFRKEKLYQESMILKDLYNESFNKVWGFVPLTDEESMLMAENFTKFYDEKLIWIASYKDKPVGFVLALPDINSVLIKLKGKLYPLGFLKLLMNKGKINCIRVLTLGVLKEYRSLGIGAQLIEKIHSRMKSGGYSRAEMSVVMENNFYMRRVLENLGFINKKTYRLYKSVL